MPNRGTNDFQVDGQNDEKTVWKIVADTLLIPMEFINSELSYQSVMQWDSMGHVNLMLAIEKNFDVKIGQDQVLELTSVSEIVSYISKCSTSNFSQKNSIKDNEKSNIIHRGLTNIYFDESEITFIDAKNGKLFHRGYSIDDLVKQASYEEVAYLLIYSDLPNKKALNIFQKKIELFRKLSDSTVSVIKLLVNNQTATNVLRTITSHLSETLADLSVEDQGIAYIAKIPTIIGTYLAFKNNKDLPQPPEKLSQAAYLLFMLLGKIPETDVIRIFEQNMILQAEHDSNASTFAARITTSTEAELGNAITSAIATFSGCLHGGALLGVVQMLQEMHDANEVKSYIQNRLKKKAPIFGFGHRVYRTEDPRAKPLKENAKILSEKYGNARLLEILEAVKAEMSGYIEHGINVNVDFYACISYLLMGLEKDMLVPIFIANRSCGWVAHIIEQKNKNILLRPRLQYTGDIKDKFIEIEQRA